MWRLLLQGASQCAMAQLLQVSDPGLTESQEAGQMTWTGEISNDMHRHKLKHTGCTHSKPCQVVQVWLPGMLVAAVQLTRT
jgi:hypothetical protein